MAAAHPHTPVAAPREIPQSLPEIPHACWQHRFAAGAFWTNTRQLRWRYHGTPRALQQGMHLSARFRSSTALIVIVLLCGTTALPLILCATDSMGARCALQQRVAAQVRCHEAQLPAASLSCCCETASDPTSTPATSIVAESSLSLVVSIAEAVPPKIEGLTTLLESAALKLHAPPLFTLHSALLL